MFRAAYVLALSTQWAKRLRLRLISRSAKRDGVGELDNFIINLYLCDGVTLLQSLVDPHRARKGECRVSENSARDEHAPLSRQTGGTTDPLEFISVSGPGHQAKSFERFKLAPPEPKKPAKNPAKKIAIIVALLLVGLVAWSVASDRLAPSSAKGAVAAYTTQIAPQVAGRVVSVSVQDNQVVHAGDPLFQLDPRPFELAVETAKANLAQVALTNEA